MVYFKAHDILEKQLSTGEIDKNTPRDSLMIRFQTFLAEVSVVGLRYVVTSSCIYRRAIWLTLILLGAGFMLFQVKDRVQYFLSRPTSADFRVRYEEELNFPAITLCNESPISRSKLQALGEYGANLTEAFKFNVVHLLDPRSKYDGIRSAINDNKNNSMYWRDLFDNVSSANTNVFYNDYLRDPDFFGTDAGQASLSDYHFFYCFYGSEPCDPDSWQYVRTDIGMCVQFNGKNSAIPLRVHAPGSSSGLHFVMSIHHDDYVSPVSHGSGLRMLIHNRTDFPHMYRHGTRVGAGHLSSVQLSYEKLVGLPKPYDDCEPDLEYNSAHCQIQCQGNYTLQQCGCLSYEQDFVAGVPYCDPERIASCLLPATLGFAAKPSLLRACNCPQQCTMEMYSYQISTQPMSRTGTDELVDFVINGMLNCQENDTRNICNHAYWYSYAQESFLQLEVYFSSMVSVVTTTEASYNALALLCDVGGALGLVVGSTFLTIAEFLDFTFVHVLSDTLHGLFNRRSRHSNHADPDSKYPQHSKYPEHRYSDQPDIMGDSDANPIKSDTGESIWPAGTLPIRSQLKFPPGLGRRLTVPYWVLEPNSGSSSTHHERSSINSDNWSFGQRSAKRFNHM